MFQKYHIQECIPVGCVPFAAVAVSGRMCLPGGGGMSAEGGCLPRGCLLSRAGVCPGRGVVYLRRGMSVQWGRECLPRGCLSRACLPRAGVCPDGVCPAGVCLRVSTKGGGCVCTPL